MHALKLRYSTKGKSYCVILLVYCMKLCMQETTEICSRIYKNKGFYWNLSTEAMFIACACVFPVLTAM